MTNQDPQDNLISRLLKPTPYRDLFRVLADSIDSPVVVISADGRKVLTCNHAFLLLTGYSRAEVPSLKPLELFADQPGQEVLGRILEAAHGGESKLEDTPLKRRDGSTTLVDTLTRPAGQDPAPLVILTPPSNVRHQVQIHRDAEHETVSTISRLTGVLLSGETSAVTESLGVARDLLSATHLGLYRVSPSSPDYRLEGSLPEGFPTGLPASEIQPLRRSTRWMVGQRPSHDLQRISRTAGLEAVLTACLGSPRAWIGILVAGWSDKGRVPADAEHLLDTIANIYHAAIQIGLQQAAVADLEKDLQVLEKQVRDQASAVTEGLLELTGGLIVRMANPAAAEMLGYRTGELENLPIQDVLVGPEDPLATILDALGHNRVAERQRLTIHRRDGTPFPVYLRVVPVEHEDDVSLVLTLSDQSERQAIESQTETLTQRALLGDVSAIFAHEVRNPINNISTGVQLVASRLGRDHELYESLERVRHECTRLDQLMSDVLFFARPLELKMEPHDLAEMIKRILLRWQPRFHQAGVNCHTTFDGDTPPVCVDPRTFRRAIVNLISNGIEAMPEGGTLSISLTPVASAQGSMVEMRIADTGPGIPPEVQDRIFNPFFTTKKGGTGLGLAITRRILTAHNGGIKVESFPDAGTVFNIRLPAANQSD